MEYKQTSYMQLNKYNIPHGMHKRKLHQKQIYRRNIKVIEDQIWQAHGLNKKLKS